MGLAASQARLLFITSRQNDVSAKMQRVSNQTMILARDEEEISDKYNKMLTQKSYKAADGASISYDALMGAQAMQNGNPYILTHKDKGVVLSSSLYNTMLKDSGLETEGSASDFTGKFKSAKAFADSIPGVSDAVLTAIDKIQGSEKEEEKSSTPKICVNTFINGLGNAGTCTQSHSISGCNYNNSGSGALNNFLSPGNQGYTVGNTNTNGIQGVFLTNITGLSNNSTDQTCKSKAVSIKDLINMPQQAYGGAMFLGTVAGGNGNTFPGLTGTPLSNFNNFVKAVGTALISGFQGMAGVDLEAISKMIGQHNGALKNEYINNINNSGTSKPSAGASDNEYKRISSAVNAGFDDCAGKYNENSLAMAMYAASRADTAGEWIHGIYTARNYDDGDDWQVAVNAALYVKELVNRVMTALTGGALDKYDASGTWGLDFDKEVEISKEYLVKGSGDDDKKSKYDDADMNTASYYIKMYNALAANGWYVESASLSSSTIDEQLKNGTYRVDDKPVGESSLYEEDASATKEDAENYYDKEMDKLRRKEKRLDTELSKLQTEYSSLTSDYESVKSIVTQNITKSFTYCQNG